MQALKWHADPTMQWLEFYVNLCNIFINSWLVVILFCTVGTTVVRGSTQEASDRSSVSFGIMLQRQTSEWCGSYWPPSASALHWNGYGCWCGVGGEGTPVDEFDAVCKVHDECWDLHRNPGEICHEAQQGHWLGYRWEWTNNEVSWWLSLIRFGYKFGRII